MPTRIRVTHADGLWAPRLGCEGVIVEPTPDQAQVYPFHDLSKSQVIIKLDDDPLVRGNDPTNPFLAHDTDWWSCAIERRHIEII